MESKGQNESPDNHKTEITYCKECEMKLAKDCTESHSKFKAFQMKHMFHLSKAHPKPVSVQTYCEEHDGISLDNYCSQHDVACCSSCVPIKHASCENVLPLNVLSRNVKKSALLSSAIKVLSDVNATLKHLHLNREVNLKHLEETEKLMVDQISDLKKRILKQIDELENQMLREIGEVVRKHSAQIAKEKQEIYMFAQEVSEKEINIQNLSEKGTEDELFLALRKYVHDINKIEEHVERMLLNFKEIDLKLTETKISSIDSLASIVEIKNKCHVKRLSGLKLDHQIYHPKTENSKPNFKKDYKLNLVTGVNYNITDLVVTNTNTLLLCNYDSEDSKIYAYKDCREFEKALSLSGSPFGISVLSETDKTAVITVPIEKTLYVINTTNLTINKSLPIKEQCYGITTMANKIVTGALGNIFILSKEGDIIKKIEIGDRFASCLKILYKEVDPYVLYRCKDSLRCVKLDGTLVYSYEASGRNGLVVDKQKNIYLSEYNGNEIICLSSNGKFNRVVLSKNDGINRPAALAFNADVSKLYVTNYDRFSVQCYTVSEESTFFV